MQFKSDMSNVTAGMDRDGNFINNFNLPYLKQMVADGQQPTSEDVNFAYDSLKESREYKDLTNTLFGESKAEDRARGS